MENVPAEHCVQAVFIMLPEGDDVPAAQEAQTFSSVKVFDVAPARAYLPIGQVKGKQSVPPVEYVPAVHV